MGEDAVCARCGERDPVAFNEVRVRFLDAHHVCGRKQEPELTILLCASCHRKLGLLLTELGLDATEPETLLHRIRNILLGLSTFFGDLADQLGHWAQELHELILQLDEMVPEWRETLEDP